MLLSSKGRGATVCQISENSVSPGVAIVERGCVEDANNGKQKIHIVAKDYLYQSTKADGTELGETVRTQVNNEVNIRWLYRRASSFASKSLQDSFKVHVLFETMFFCLSEEKRR